MTNRTGKKNILRINISSIFVLLAAILIVTKVFRTFSGIVGQSGGVWNIIQITFVIVGIIWFARYYRVCKAVRPIAAIVILDFYMLIRALPELSFSVSGLFSYLMIPYAAAVLIIFYIIGMKAALSERSLLYYAFYITIFIIIGAMMRFYSQGSRSSFIRLIDVADVYFGLGLLPVAFLYVKRKYQFIPVILMAIALIFTGKRAGILAVFAMTLALFLMSEEKRGIKDRARRILLLIVSLVVIYYAAFYLDSFFNLRLFWRLSQMSEDGGSGRLSRWRTVYVALKNSDIIHLIFGHGWGSVNKFLGGHAHNDFMELFYDYGLIAAVFYIWFYLSLIVTMLKMVKSRYRYISIFAASLICSLFLSMFSFYFISPTYITCGMICFGFLLSDYRKWKMNLEVPQNVNS